MLAEIVDGDGAKRVEADMERHPLDVEAAQDLLREVQSRRRGGGGARLERIHGLVALGIGEWLGDVRRQRRLPGGLAVQAQAPSSLADVLQQLDRPVALTGSQPSCRT